VVALLTVLRTVRSVSSVIGQWRFYVGAGGAQAPQMLARPPQIFGQLNFFLETGNQEIIELSVLSHIACYLT
jgi:hypothetical protein